MVEQPTALGLAWAVIALSFLSGCANQSKLREAELAQLAEWLPGHYDNTAQARADAERGATAHEALALLVVPIYAAPIGKHAFYIQETAADDPMRVTGQRVIAFDLDAKGERIIQAAYALAEPGRWRDAHMNPDLFKGLIPHEDLRAATGCELVWKKDGERFTGANDAARCRASSRVTGATVRMEMRAELTPSELALSDRSYDAAGKLVYGPAEEPYRFVKRAD